MQETTELSATARVRLNGRVTLPFELREALGIKDGDTVHITVSKVITEASASHVDPLKAHMTA